MSDPAPSAAPLRIIVTGASRGIGAAIVTALSDGGHKVLGLSSRDGNLADPAVPAWLWAMAGERLGGAPDVLINNAGVFEPNPIDSADADWLASWNRTLQINLTASAELCRFAVRDWRAAGRGGRIVNIASRAAYRGDRRG